MGFPLKTVLLRLVQGFIIGAGGILPGISGGVLSVIFGIYRPVMEVLAHPLNGLRRHLSLLLPVGAGAILGFLFCGLLWGLSLIVPGMTSSSILMAVGLFTPMAEGFARLDMAVILPWLLGMVLIVLTLARVVNWCFRAHYPLFYHAVFGIVLASTVVIIPLHYDGARDALLCLLAAALGALAAYLSAKLQPKEDA